MWFEFLRCKNDDSEELDWALIKASSSSLILPILIYISEGKLRPHFPPFSNRLPSERPTITTLLWLSFLSVFQDDAFDAGGTQRALKNMLGSRAAPARPEVTMRVSGAAGQRQPWCLWDSGDKRGLWMHRWNVFVWEITNVTCNVIKASWEPVTTAWSFWPSWFISNDSLHSSLEQQLMETVFPWQSFINGLKVWKMKEQFQFSKLI